MELIDELEPVKRGIYGGACGYLSFGGDGFAIAIRTGAQRWNVWYVQAAAGVVADSVPEMEMARNGEQSTRHVARQNAQDGLDGDIYLWRIIQSAGAVFCFVHMLAISTLACCAPDLHPLIEFLRYKF